MTSRANRNHVIPVSEIVSKVVMVMGRVAAAFSAFAIRCSRHPSKSNPLIHQGASLHLLWRVIQFFLVSSHGDRRPLPRIVLSPLSRPLGNFCSVFRIRVPTLAVVSDVKFPDAPFADGSASAQPSMLGSEIVNRLHHLAFRACIFCHVGRLA